VLFLLPILSLIIYSVIVYNLPITPVSCVPDGYMSDPTNVGLICVFTCGYGNYCSVADTSGSMGYPLYNPVCQAAVSDYVECSGVSYINCGLCFSMCNRTKNPPNFGNSGVDICSVLSQGQVDLILGVCMPILVVGWLVCLWCCENWFVGFCVDKVERECDLKKTEMKYPILRTHKQLACRKGCDC